MSFSEDRSRNQELVQTIQDALDGNELLRVREALKRLHPFEIADLLESLPAQQRDELWVHIDPEIEGDVLSHASAPVRAGLLEQMKPAQVAAATESLDSDDAADILQDLPEPIADEVLRSMDEQNRKRIATVLTYPEDTAGGLMDVDTVTVRSDVDIDVVLRYLRRLGEMPDRTDSLIVVDRDNTYLGVISLATLVTAQPAATVGELMQMDEDGIPAQLPAEDVAVLFEQRDLLSAAVVDDRGKVLGRITVDDVVDVIRQQSDRAFMSAAGLDIEEDIFAPVFTASKRRALWLGVNLATAFLAASVIGQFETTIDHLVALAVLMPVVASMGGIAGSQTLTIVIRGLALGQVGSANSRSLLLRELGVGILNGLLWATVVAAIVAAWFSDLGLGAVFGAAIIVNLVMAAFSGTLIPLLLKKLHIDPALAGGVILTTVTDCVGFFAFLGLATIFLV